MSTWPSSRNKPSATMVSPSLASITLCISVCFCVFIFFLFMRRRDFLWGLIPGLLDSGILGVSLCARARARFFNFLNKGGFDLSVC
jgi:hypothetical protein